MDFVENFRVSQERTKAGFGAEIDRPPAIFSSREICRIGIAKDPSTERDESARGWFLLNRMNGHY